MLASSTADPYLSVAGRTAPAATLRAVPDLAEEPVEKPSRPDRPPQLDDADWLRRRLESDGTMGIALELGVTRYAVRVAVERHGLTPHPAGRRRGVISVPVLSRRATRQPAAERVAERIAEESQPNGPAPTERLIAARTVAYHDAKLAGDQLAMLDAAISAAAAWTRLADHLQLLHAA